MKRRAFLKAAVTLPAGLTLFGIPKDTFENEYLQAHNFKG